MKACAQMDTDGGPAGSTGSSGIPNASGALPGSWPALFHMPSPGTVCSRTDGGGELNMRGPAAHSEPRFWNVSTSAVPGPIGTVKLPASRKPRERKKSHAL